MLNESEFYCPDCDNGLDVRAPRSRRQTRREFLGTAVASWHDYAPGVSDRTRRQARDYYRRATRPHRHEIYGPGTFIVADGKMLLLTTNGWLSVVEVSARGHKTLASAQVITVAPAAKGRGRGRGRGRRVSTGRTIPVLLDGRIYLRDETSGTIVCLDVRKPGEAGKK